MRLYSKNIQVVKEYFDSVSENYSERSKKGFWNYLRKRESNEISNLIKKLKLDYVTILINLKVVLESNQEKENQQNNISKQISNKKKMRRNEPCFCGSGKKFKHCHGAI